MNSSLPSADFFRDLERTRTAALVEKNMPVALRLHAANYMLISPSGRAFTRERYLGMIESSSMNYRLWQLGNIDVRISQAMAVVRYQATLAFRTQQGDGEPFSLWHTDSYELGPDSWQAVWSQATKVA